MICWYSPKWRTVDKSSSRTDLCWWSWSLVLMLNVVIKRRSSVAGDEVNFSKNAKKAFLFGDLSSFNLLSLSPELSLIYSYFPTTERFHSGDFLSKTHFIECLEVRECVTTPLHGLRWCTSCARVLILNRSVSNLAFNPHRHWKDERIVEVWVVVCVWYGDDACGCGWDDEGDENLGACEEEVHVRSCGRVWVALKAW